MKTLYRILTDISEAMTPVTTQMRIPASEYGLIQAWICGWRNGKQLRIGNQNQFQFQPCAFYSFRLKYPCERHGYIHSSRCYGLISGICICKSLLFGQGDHPPYVPQQPYYSCLTHGDFYLFKNQIPLERNKMSRRRRNSSEYDKASAHCTKKGVPGMIPSMEMTLDKACSFGSRLLRRRLYA